MSNRKDVAIYARVSTTDQTLDPQLRDLRAYCQSRGWEAVEYVDHGISGAKDSRPGWNQCWDAVQKGRVRVLLVHALDRLGRSLPHLVSIINFCVERNVTLVSFRENIDLSTAAGRMLAGIFSVMAEYERSIISERTKSGMRAAKARGKRIGNRMNGFDRKKATEMRLQGWGQIRIAKALGVGVGRVNAWVKGSVIIDGRSSGRDTQRSLLAVGLDAPIAPPDGPSSSISDPSPTRHDRRARTEQLRRDRQEAVE